MNRRIVVEGNKFAVARMSEEAGLPFVFEREAGLNTVGVIPGIRLLEYQEFFGTHPELAARFARYQSKRGGQ